MLAPLSSLEAYRRDAVSLDGDGLDDATAAAWLEAAARLERAAMVRGPERERLLRSLLAQLGVVALPTVTLSSETIASTVSALATQMEDQSFFRLASNLLTSLLLMLPEDEILLRGRVIATQGRLARHVGDKAAANRWYGIVEQMGGEHRIPELTGRAWLGYGLLAYTRGDFPEARRQFNNVIELPGAAPDSVAGAHHQLMAAAAAAKDYDTAAAHAWKAFEGASTPAQETEALVNLAQLLLDAGHARPALRGFAAALARNPIARQALPTLGGAACAAAAALEPTRARVLVRNFANRVQELVTSLGDGARLPWPSASALVEISEALAAIGDESEANRVASRAEGLAHAHGFHQLTYRLENPVFVAQPVELAPATASILDAVDELEGAELVGAAC